MPKLSGPSRVWGRGLGLGIYKASDLVRLRRLYDCTCLHV